MAFVIHERTTRQGVRYGVLYRERTLWWSKYISLTLWDNDDPNSHFVSLEDSSLFGFEPKWFASLQEAIAFGEAWCVEMAKRGFRENLLSETFKSVKA